MGPYDTEQQAAAEPMPREVADIYDQYATRKPGDPDPRQLVRDVRLRYLTVACSDAGVELGEYDERVLVWLARWEPSTVQAVIGLIGRAYDAGLRDGGA